MKYDIDYEKAMEMVNGYLREMKEEIDEVEQMKLKGGKKRLALCMKRIYKRLEETVNVYAKTQEHGDFNSVCRELEALQPAFILNYNEICYDNGLEKLNETLDEMEEELSKVDQKCLTQAEAKRAEEMHQIYDQIHDKVDRYAQSHDHEDFESAVHEVEKLKPEFILVYNELTD